MVKNNSTKETTKMTESTKTTAKMDWQTPFQNIAPGKSTVKAYSYNDLKITKYHNLFQIKLGQKSVAVKDTFIFLKVNRLTLTLDESIQALTEYKESGEIESFEIV